MNPSPISQLNTALDWAIILLAVITIAVGIGAIMNAVRVNKEKHGERTRHGDLHAVR